MNVVVTYIIKTDISNLYKIGRSKNVNKRINQIKGSLLFVNLELIHVFPYDCEKKLHKYFKSKRKEGEWFELSFEDLEFIKNTDWQTPKQQDFVYINPEILSKMNKPGMLILNEIICNLKNKQRVVGIFYSELKEKFTKDTFNKGIENLLSKSILTKTEIPELYRLNKKYIYKDINKEV